MSEESLRTDRATAERVQDLERQVRTLAAAVHALAEGLAPNPAQGRARIDVDDAARLAHDMLIAAGL
ncbi:MAG TPA: hypothetical protein VL551_25390 [Actinospica sp.]|jgi:hypothetical protein|nr:hypothetical protein [Actinospica sp.]